MNVYLCVFLCLCISVCVCVCVCVCAHEPARHPASTQHQIQPPPSRRVRRLQMTCKAQSQRGQRQKTCTLVLSVSLHELIQLSIRERERRGREERREERREIEEKEGVLCACAYIIYNQPWRAKVASLVDLIILNSQVCISN